MMVETEQGSGLALRGLRKTFGATTALAGVDLSLQPGMVHGLVGQNGSGKSTLVKILAGYHSPDGGVAEFGTTTLKLPLSERLRTELGLSFVHQDLGLCETFTVAETVQLRTLQCTRYGRIRWSQVIRRVDGLLSRLGTDIDVRAEIRSLTPAQRAVVAILRAVYGQRFAVRILVLDEATAALGRAEVEQLAEVIHHLRDTGVAILFVSHRLEEIFQLCDWVTVLRDGRVVRSASIAAVDSQQLVLDIVGRELAPSTSSIRTVRRGPRPTLLAVDDLAGAHVQHLSFTVGEGEVLGITGLSGMGQDDVPYLLVGATRRTSGRVAVGGHALGFFGPREARARGLVVLPAERNGRSGIPRATVAENVTMPIVNRFFRRGWLRESRERAVVRTLLVAHDVRPQDPTLPLFTLSGGNQQKALVAKWLEAGARVLVLHEPTRGVDIGARAQIYAAVAAASSRGLAILVISSDFEETARLCQRVIVMRYGVAVRELIGRAITPTRIADASYAID